MCLQTFTYYACQHQQLVTQNCELSLEHPFWSPVACPSYTIQSSRLDHQACGLGGFYCTQTKDGSFLDTIHHKYERTHNILVRLDEHLSRIRDAARRALYGGDGPSTSDDAHSETPAFARLMILHRQVLERRFRLERTRIMAMAILRDADAYYRKRGAHSTIGDGSVFPAFVPVSDVLPTMAIKGLPGTNSMSVEQPAPGSIDTPLRPEQTSKHLTNHLRPMPLPITPQAEQIKFYSTPVQSSSETYPVTSIPRHKSTTSKDHSEQGVHSTEHKRSRSLHLFQTMPPPDSARRLRRSSKRASFDRKLGQPFGSRIEKPDVKYQETVKEERRSLRRSARVQGKRVKYAESSGSSSPGRGSSPLKSDRSTSSPSKSHQHRSPIKREGPESQASISPPRVGDDPHRADMSLADKINSWKKISLGSTSMQLEGTDIRGIHNVFFEQPDLSSGDRRLPQVQLNYGDDATSAADLPYNLWTEPQAYGRPAIEPSFSPLDQFLPEDGTRPDTEMHTQTSGHHPPVTAAAGFLHPTCPEGSINPAAFLSSKDPRHSIFPQFQDSTPVEAHPSLPLLDYEDLHRSFTNPIILDASRSSHPTPPNPEPRKRSPPASTPSPSLNKRQRQSLLGAAQTPAPELASQRFPDLSPDPGAFAAVATTPEDNTVTPGPSRSPDALMYGLLRHDREGESVPFDRTVFGPGQVAVPDDSKPAGFVGNVDDYLDGETSDIDWGFDNDLV